MLEKLIDEELGCILIRENARARRLTFHTRGDAIYVTVPCGTTMDEVKSAVHTLRHRLLLAKQKQARPLIDLNYRIEAEFFKLSLISGTGKQFLAHSDNGRMQIVCPPDTDFKDEKLQAWLRKVIEQALRRSAKLILPIRLNELALIHGLSYQSVKINSSKGRWGSCSGNRSINLSCYMLLLPLHLIDYVLLHELAHTREMNHGEKFWRFLDSLTECKGKELREELKSYSISI